MRGVSLWLLGVPISIIILLYLFNVLYRREPGRRHSLRFGSRLRLRKADFLLEPKERKLRRWLTRTEARQGEGPRAMLWVLVASLTLACLVGFALALGWINLPSTG